MYAATETGDILAAAIESLPRLPDVVFVRPSAVPHVIFHKPSEREVLWLGVG